MALTLQLLVIIIIYIQCESQSPQTIECIGIDACKKQTIQCDPYKPCSLLCHGKAACSEVIFIGTTSTDVTMLCSPEDSCKKATVACGTGKCAIDCIAEVGKTVCTELDVIINQAISFQCTNSCPIDIQRLTFTVSPTPSPTHNPSITPTKKPSISTTSPTRNPTKSPTYNPTPSPSKYTSLMPTAFPTEYPTEIATISPTYIPTTYPTQNPSNRPTNIPMTIHPIIYPTQIPTPIPTAYPTITPTNNPSSTPSVHPTPNPTGDPMAEPTPNPTPNPTKLPTITAPTWLSTDFPSSNPVSVSPTTSPLDDPSIAPTLLPTLHPTATLTPSEYIIQYINTPQPTRRVMVNTDVNTTLFAVGNGPNEYEAATLWQRLGRIHILWYISTVALVILCCTLFLLIAFCLCVQRDVKSLSVNGQDNIDQYGCEYAMELENMKNINNIFHVHGQTDCEQEQEESPMSIAKQLSNAASVGVDSKEEYDCFDNDELREGQNATTPKMQLSHNGKRYCEINEDFEEEKDLKYHQIPSVSCLMIADMLDDDDDDIAEYGDGNCFVLEAVVQDETMDDFEVMDEFEITNEINEYRRVSKLRGQSISIWSGSDDMDDGGGQYECVDIAID